MALKNKIILNKLTFVGFDIETTGLDPREHEIIEIGAVRFSMEEGLMDTFSSLVAPENPIPPKMTKIHGITNEMVKDAPSIDRVLEDFIGFIGDDPLLAHNSQFDAKFIAYYLDQHELSYGKNLIYDTLPLSRKIILDSENHKLPTLVERFKIKVSQAHRALDDSKACMEVFIKLMSLWIGNEDRYLTDLNTLKKPVRFSKFV